MGVPHPARHHRAAHHRATYDRTPHDRTPHHRAPHNGASQGDGNYSILVFLEGQQVASSACSRFCQLETDTPETPDTPTPVPTPEGTPGVIIPVTGVDLGGQAALLTRTFQNLGIGLPSLGLVLHGLSMREFEE